jgi:hypothetical protein
MSSGTEHRRTCLSSREGSRDAIVVALLEKIMVHTRLLDICTQTYRERDITYVFIDWHVKVND